MDFSRYDSWVKVPPRKYKEYENEAGAWDGITESHHSQVASIIIEKDDGSKKCIGITFVEQIDALDVWRLSYAASLSDYALNNVYNGDDADPEIKHCAACFATETHVLGYFVDQREAFEACDGAAERIAEEVEDALRYHRPSLYFSTYFLTTNYWPFGGKRPENDTGGTYTIEYAPEEVEKEETNTDEPKPAFIEAAAENNEHITLKYIYMEEAFIREVCQELRFEECCDREEWESGILLFFSKVKFEQELQRAIKSVIDTNTESMGACYIIVEAMQHSKIKGVDIRQIDDKSLIRETAIDLLNNVYNNDDRAPCRESALRYVYSRIAEYKEFPETKLVQPTKTEEKKTEEEPQSFLEILWDMDSPASLDYYKLKDALVRGVCKELEFEKCGTYRKLNTGIPITDTFFVVDEMFDEELREAYQRFLDECVGETDDCYQILKGMQEEKFSNTDIRVSAEDAIRKWVGEDDIRIDVLKYVYSELGKCMYVEITDP